MDDLDRKILTIVNNALPLDERPFRTVAGQVGISEDEVIERLRALKEQGVIRRVGAVINPRKMGWHSTLCGVSVPEDKIGEYAAVVNAYPEVTHNYVREGEPNCWFTLIAPNEERARGIIREIEERLGVKVLDLPATKTFKIKVSFDL
jgi:siroheme decarboxylase